MRAWPAEQRKAGRIDVATYIAAVLFTGLFSSLFHFGVHYYLLTSAQKPPAETEFGIAETSHTISHVLRKSIVSDDKSNPVAGDLIDRGGRQPAAASAPAPPRGELVRGKPW